MLTQLSYEAKIFDHLLGVAGLSEQLLKNHFTLYHGYVTNTNKLNDILVGLEKEEKFGTSEYAELNRRFGWEFNGMRLHEYYFGNITKDFQPPESNSELIKAISKEWGSFEMWEKDFKSMGMMRGIGWVILYYDKLSSRLFNIWINEHDVGHLAGAIPLLVMDVFEHAYLIDYGLKRANYVEAFFKTINWSVVSEKFS